MNGANQTVGPVVFDYAWLQRRYPLITEWCDVDTAQSYFDLACVFCDNSDAGGVVPAWGPLDYAVLIYTVIQARGGMVHRLLT